MYPFIFKSGEFVVPAFFFMTMLGVLACTFYAYFRAPKHGFSQVAILDMGIIGAICGILGARLFHVFFEYPWFYLEDPLRFFEFWRGGFVSFGAYIGGALSLMLYLKIRKLPILKYGDFAVLGVPFLIIFIRLGCLGAGCCYGKPTEFIFHLIFDHPASDAGSKFAGQTLHATQIYDLLNGVFIFAVLNLRYAKRKFDGEIVLLLFMLYSLIRGVIEFLRGDADRGVYLDGTLSTGQITGALIFVFCLVLYVVLWKRKKRLS